MVLILRKDGDSMKKKYGIILLVVCTMVFSLFYKNNTKASNDEMITDYFTIVNEDGSVDRIEKSEIEGNPSEEASVYERIGGDEDPTTGTVYFRTYGDIIEYTHAYTGAHGYITGSYGADGAYLGMHNGKVRAKISGIVGDFDPEDVKVVDFHRSPDPVSYYMSESDGYLRHYYVYGSGKHIATTRVGYNLDYLKTDVRYYSYDGHYFYDSYDKMVKDYKNETYRNAVNANEPYYNYYQYLSHRSKTSLTGRELNQITQNTIANYSPSDTKFYEIGNAFIENQNAYGVNAILMFGVAANESNWGRSEIAFDKNNLFGHGANDNDPYYGANGYDTPSHSIRDHAYYWVSRGFLDYDDSRHFGASLGDKETGMNVKYASDPYWGEKAASQAYYAGKVLSDYQKETIGIVEGYESLVNLYAKPGGKVLASLRQLSNTPVLIIGTETYQGKTYYKIQSDTSINSSRSHIDYDLVYDFEDSYLYIEASKVKIVCGSISEEKPENGGLVDGGTVTMKMGSNVSDLLKKFPSGKVYTHDGKLTTTILGTGYTLEVDGKRYTVIVLGDNNADGKITPADYVRIKNHIMEYKLLTDKHLEAADANDDGKITPADYVRVKNYIMSQ